ncbi:classical arabinogalactan protein 26-like [Melia azedarach]|uniref:Classical arabinogalactan protein 26-like n=1 Tax=Melia azedarach TaxID=155640 RepID=A0ACC1YWN8_MELAZ|nr:classical arabinogalactan protein 26-like [Melia azedarach]
MASFSSFLATFMVFMAYFTSPAFQSEMHVQFSTISAAPAFLPSTAPLPSPSASAPTLSPDITPLFPTPKGMAPSPAASSLPTIPSSPSPPNPDDLLAPGPQTAFAPSGLLPASSSVSLASTGHQNFALFFGLLLFCLLQLACM